MPRRRSTIKPSGAPSRGNGCVGRKDHRAGSPNQKPQFSWLFLALCPLCLCGEIPPCTLASLTAVSNSLRSGRACLQEKAEARVVPRVPTAVHPWRTRGHRSPARTRPNSVPENRDCESNNDPPLRCLGYAIPAGAGPMRDRSPRLSPGMRRGERLLLPGGTEQDRAAPAHALLQQDLLHLSHRRAPRILCYPCGHIFAQDASQELPTELRGCPAISVQLVSPGQAP